MYALSSPENGLLQITFHPVGCLFFPPSWLLRRQVAAAAGVISIAFAVFAPLFTVMAAWPGGEHVARLSVSADSSSGVNSPTFLASPHTGLGSSE